MSLTSMEIDKLITSWPLRFKIGDVLEDYRKEHNIRYNQCLYCKKTNKAMRDPLPLGSFYFCNPISAIDDDWVDCAEQFYMEHQELLLEWITE